MNEKNGGCAIKKYPFSTDQNKSSTWLIRWLMIRRQSLGLKSWISRGCFSPIFQWDARRDVSDSLKTLTKSAYIPGIWKSTPFDWKYAGNDKVSLISEWTANFVNLKLRFTYLAFKSRPPNTGDTSSQIQNLQWNQRFEKWPNHDLNHGHFPKHL